jgi:hypothetical protein
MKIALTVLFILSLSTLSLAQTNQQPQLEPKPERSVTQRQIVDLPLPERNFRPKLTLQRALQLAERYIAKEKIDLSRFYLYEAKYISYGSKDHQEPCWFFWWVNENGAAGNYVEIIVSIETGNARRLPSM